VLDADGEERYRIEGYLPKDWIRARLEIALARVAFMRKQWQEAEKIVAAVAGRHPDLAVAAEAIYWRAVCQYKTTNDHTVLAPAAKELSENYPGNEWTLKAGPWSH
jgi:hypothetical protein